MPQYCRKNREIEPIDYDNQVQTFLKSDKVAFIPDEQRDTNRYHWHCAGEKLGLVTKTIKIWQEIALCGMHHRPIIAMKPSTDFGSQCYDSDYECDYECNDEDDEDGCIGNCCYLEHKHQKLRTVVIFNQEASEKIKNMDLIEIKDFLAQSGIIQKDKGRYSK